MKAPTPCGSLGCLGYAINYGKCADHQPVPFKGSTRAQRLPKDWTTRRLIVLKRDHGICYLCHQPGADTIDHIIPGDDHALNNLAPVHDTAPPHCHRSKTAKEGSDAVRNNRIKRRH